ncbi:DUF6515 family protein [Aquabacterium sp.]|uniref:DUF6515 family protein n=1 Tax=Aquabacterium sp. TaxID=1872578 RepID=UPI0035AEABD0
MRLKHIALAAIATSLLVLGLQAQAQERRPGGGPRPGGAPAPNWRFDDRFHHDRYYPAPGGYVGVLPGGSVSIGFGADNFFFNAGVWFRPAGGRFLIVTPPIGIVIPILPPGYVTLMIGGLPYYYANGVYYNAVPQGYAVVNAPTQVPETATPVNTAPASSTPPEPIIYPRNGQTATQTQADRQECNRWATGQPKASDPTVFVRAVTACMEARGYTVR